MSILPAAVPATRVSRFSRPTRRPAEGSWSPRRPRARAPWPTGVAPRAGFRAAVYALLTQQGRESSLPPWRERFPGRQPPTGRPASTHAQHAAEAATGAEPAVDSRPYPVHGRYTPRDPRSSTTPAPRLRAGTSPAAQAPSAHRAPPTPSPTAPAPSPRTTPTCPRTRPTPPPSACRRQRTCNGIGAQGFDLAREMGQQAVRAR